MSELGKYTAERIEHRLLANRQASVADYWEQRGSATRIVLTPHQQVDAQAVKQAEIDLACLFGHVMAVIRNIGGVVKIIFWVKP